MRVVHLLVVIVLLVLPLVVSAAPAPPASPSAPAPAAAPGGTVVPPMPAVPPDPPVPPSPPTSSEDGRVRITTQPGGTADPEATLHYKGPKFAWEGAEMDLTIPGWYPGMSIPVLMATWGVWGGGRGTVFIMPLDDRLGKLTDAHNMDAFDGFIFTIGPRLAFEVDRTLRINFFFETGSTDVEEQVNGHEQQAHVNLTRLGIGLEALQPIDRIVKLSPGLNSPPPMLFIKPGDIRIGFGIEMGGGNLNMSFRGPNEDNDWTHNEPLMFMTPMAIASVPLSNWSSLDFYAGYQFVRMNEFSMRYFENETDKIRGNDFDGWVGGVQMMFGSNILNELGKRPK